MDGVLLIDKPSGPTSFDVVRGVRRLVGERKVGHTGTLDPLASGLLVCCLGQGTKLVPYLMDSEKAYAADIALGSQTDTDDALGEIVESSPVPVIGEEALKAALVGFTGRIQQVPPVYSAIKVDGQPLYRRARRGEQVTPKTREVEIFGLAISGFDGKHLKLDVRCGSGTYIRSLARDLGRVLGTHGHLAGLRRLETGGFHVDDAVTLTRFEGQAGADRIETHLLPLAEAIRSMPKRKVDEHAAEKLSHGQRLALDQIAEEGTDLAENELVALIGPGGDLLAIAERESHGLHPIRVFC
jgi:tRNA pseudouridine55 synthase